MVDLILVMTVNPGFGGQKFLTGQLDKIRTLRQSIDRYVAGGGAAVDLEVDGGVDTDTIALAAEAGANAFVAGTATFRGGPGAYAGNISALRSAAGAG
jgi:ribulose-phosphate 3-epimerase